MWWLAGSEGGDVCPPPSMTYSFPFSFSCFFFLSCRLGKRGVAVAACLTFHIGPVLSSHGTAGFFFSWFFVDLQLYQVCQSTHLTKAQNTRDYMHPASHTTPHTSFIHTRSATHLIWHPATPSHTVSHHTQPHHTAHSNHPQVRHITDDTNPHQFTHDTRPHHTITPTWHQPPQPQRHSGNNDSHPFLASEQQKVLHS